MPVRLTSARAPRRRVRRKGREYDPGVDTSKVGIEAARLMEELAEEMPEDAELRHVTVVAVVEEPSIAGGVDQRVFLRSSAQSRLEQIGTLQTAVAVAIDAEPEE
jgi:hypothetical protein